MGAPNVDGCGTGYGNHVRILSPEGFMTIYAHLSHITITNKQKVKQGEKIELVPEDLQTISIEV